MPRPYLLTVAFTILAILAGCGVEGETVETEPASVELGQLELPLWMADGYGQDSRQRRCIASRGWGPGSWCDVPRWKSATIGLAWSHGCTAFQRNILQYAIEHAANIARDQGWDVNVLPEGVIGDGGGENGWPVACRAIGGNVLARTRVSKVPGIDYECLDVTFIGIPTCSGCKYKVCKYEAGWVEFDFAAISGLSGYTQLSTAAEKYLLINIATHEFMHIFGLGHEPDAFSDQVLMSIGTTLPVHASKWGTKLFLPTLQERSFMRRYNPDGNNPLP